MLFNKHLAYILSVHYFSGWYIAYELFSKTIAITSQCLS